MSVHAPHILLWSTKLDGWRAPKHAYPEEALEALNNGSRLGLAEIIVKSKLSEICYSQLVVGMLVWND